MLRCFLIPFVVMSLACCQPASAQMLSEEAKQASAFIEELSKDQAYRIGIRDAIDRKIVAKQLDKTLLLQGALDLLRAADKEHMPKIVEFLGKLRDQSVVPDLVRVLAWANEGSRESICYALQRLDAKGEPAESALVRLRREDPSTDVRFSASIALARPEDPEAVAAFERGLLSTSNGWIRDRCEHELEKQGKLQLPLPEKIYTEIDKKRYEELKTTLRVRIRREVTKGDTLFFEVVWRFPDGVPTRYSWYRMKVEPKKAPTQETKKPSSKSD